MVNTWITDIDEGNYVGSVFLDLRKAFDLVDHQILLHKLKLYHFTDKSNNLIKSYLSNRQQMVKVANLNSNILQINSGVPQGSILGSILFLICMYVNDLTWTYPEVDIDLYANDSTMYKIRF